MLLGTLLQGVEYTGEAPEALEINDVTADSRKACRGGLFVCIAGAGADGHDYAPVAAQAGCVAIVAERLTAAELPHILVKNPRLAYALICANFFGNPAESLRLVGVTGTNGKTTTTFILKHILEENGHKCGLIGTIRNMAGEEMLPARYTTPEPYELQRLFAEMVKHGCDYVVMEVSSQALAQERVAGCRFVAGVFTNLTQDHLDYHKTMENYFGAKLRLFDQSALAVINLDDEYAGRLIAAVPCRAITYSARNMEADYTARNIRYRVDGTDYDMVGLGVIGRVKLRIPGSFNVYNSLAAISCAVSLGLPLQGVLDAVRSAAGVMGRLEVMPLPPELGFSVIIDYAHTPDGLKKTLAAVGGFKHGRVVCVFGCGGDRDKTKRPQMGAIAASMADFVVVTSDNPRSEDPTTIINEILDGMKGSSTPMVSIENRREAIEFAIRSAKKDDIILLAGKGHEDYQILKTGKIHFDEREVVSEILAPMKE